VIKVENPEKRINKIASIFLNIYTCFKPDPKHTNEKMLVESKIIPCNGMELKNKIGAFNSIGIDENP
tara:strand:- start:111 stop:311 length:201 start_codon:yes stop_codon:yes gene_type:complete